MRYEKALLGSCILIMLSGCLPGQKAGILNTPSPSPETATVVESGLLTSKKITIYNEGSHLLTTDEGKKFALKSSTVDLSKFEDYTVTVTGEMSASTQDEVSIITVFAVDKKEAPSSERLSLFNETAFGFSASLPGNWQRSLSEKGDVLQYYPEEADPVISISKLTTKSPAGVEAQAAMKSGAEVSVGGKNGVRVLKNGETDIYIPSLQRQEIIAFHFEPGKSPEKEKISFYEMLTSLKWTEGVANASPLATAAAPLATDKCGGTAKKLCPAGYRCELQSLEEGATGVCIDANLPPSDISETLSFNRKNDLEITKPPAGSASPTPAVSDETPPAPESSWARYENTGFSYSYAMPKSWWWRNLGASNGALSRLEASPEEVTDENWIVAIEVLPDALQSAKETTANGSIKISLPKDQKTHFEVTGKSGYASDVRKVADSLFSL